MALKGMSGDYGGSLPAQGDGPIRTRRGDKLATLRLLERGYLRGRCWLLKRWRRMLDQKVKLPGQP